MRSQIKLLTTIWTTLLASPILFLSMSYARLECGEMDPCPTGGAMPYAVEAIFLGGLVLVLQLAFLVLIWRPGSKE